MYPAGLILGLTLQIIVFVSPVLSRPPTSKFGENVTAQVLGSLIVKYNGEHEIVKIEIPINKINRYMYDAFAESYFEKMLTNFFYADIKYKEHLINNRSDKDLNIFFIEGDIKENGEVDFKGLYVLNIFKKGCTKLMDNARDVTSEVGDNKNLFIAASDGLYTYDTKLKVPVKYGTLSEGLLSIQRPSNTDILYALNDKYELLNITDGGTKSVIISNVKNARQIMLDYKNNLFYMDTDKNIFVMDSYGVKQVKGLPEKKSYVKLIKPILAMKEGALVLIDNQYYEIFANSTSNLKKGMLEVKPTACDPSLSFLQYYGYQKKIVEYSPFLIYLKAVFEDLTTGKTATEFNALKY